MVLKVLFVDLPSEESVGLEGRLSPELFRMVEDYRSEREVSGRSLPIGYKYLMRLQEYLH